MAKTFTLTISENKIGASFQSYENGVALGIPVFFPSKSCFELSYRENLYKEIERVKGYTLTSEEKQHIDELINSLNLNELL